MTESIFRNSPGATRWLNDKIRHAPMLLMATSAHDMHNIAINEYGRFYLPKNTTRVVQQAGTYPLIVNFMVVAIYFHHDRLTFELYLS